MAVPLKAYRVAVDALCFIVILFAPYMLVQFFVSQDMSRELVDQFLYHMNALIALNSAEVDGLTIKPIYAYFGASFVALAASFHFAMSLINSMTEPVHLETFDGGKVVFSYREKWLL